MLLLLLSTHSAASDSLRPHGLQLARLPCPLPSPGVCSDSCPLSQWCHPNISSPAASFSSCLQYFPASGSFPMSWLFTSGGQSSGASASTSVLPMDPIFLFGCYCLSQRSSVDSQSYPGPEPMSEWLPVLGIHQAETFLWDPLWAWVGFSLLPDILPGQTGVSPDHLEAGSPHSSCWSQPKKDTETTPCRHGYHAMKPHRDSPLNSHGNSFLLSPVALKSLGVLPPTLCLTNLITSEMSLSWFASSAVT